MHYGDYDLTRVHGNQACHDCQEAQIEAAAHGRIAPKSNPAYYQLSKPGTTLLVCLKHFYTPEVPR